MLRRPPTTIVLQPEDIAIYTQSRAHRLATLAAQKQHDERLLRKQAAQLHQQRGAPFKPSDEHNTSAEMDVDTEEDEDADGDVNDGEEEDVDVARAGREENWTTTTPTPGAARVTRRGGGFATEGDGPGRSQGTGVREKRRALRPPSPARDRDMEAGRVVSDGESIRGMMRATERPRDTVREEPRRDVRSGTDRERQTSERTRAAERTARIMGAGGGGEGGAGTGAGRSRS